MRKINWKNTEKQKKVKQHHLETSNSLKVVDFKALLFEHLIATYGTFLCDGKDFELNEFSIKYKPVTVLWKTVYTATMTIRDIAEKLAERYGQFQHLFGEQENEDKLLRELLSAHADSQLEVNNRRSSIKPGKVFSSIESEYEEKGYIDITPPIPVVTFGGRRRHNERPKVTLK